MSDLVARVVFVSVAVIAIELLAAVSHALGNRVARSWRSIDTEKVYLALALALGLAIGLIQELISEARKRISAHLRRMRAGVSRSIVLPRTLIAVAVCFLPKEHRCRYEEEFRNELAELHRLRGLRASSPYAGQQLLRAGRLRAALLSRAPRTALTRVLTWVLSSNARTRSCICPVLLVGGLETAKDTGPAAAVLAVVGAAGAFAWLVRTLRARLGIEQPRPAASSSQSK